MLVIVITHVIEPFIDAAEKSDRISPLFRAMLSVNVCCRFGVPCFMMISFFIYWHQLYEKGRSWGQLLKRRLQRLVPAFICWSTFYLTIHKTIQHFYQNHQWDSGLYNLRLADKANWSIWYKVYVLGQAETHLYYLPLVMACLLLIPLLKLLWRRPLVSWGWIALTVAAWLFMCYAPVMAPPSSQLQKLALQSCNWGYKILALPSLVFPLIGMMCAGQKSFRQFIARSPVWVWVAILGLGLAMHSLESQYLLQFRSQDAFQKSLAQAMNMDFVSAYHRALALLKPGRLLTGAAVFILVIRHPLMRDPFPMVSHYAFGLHFLHPAIILGLRIVELKLLGPAVGGWEIYVVPMLALNLLLTLCITFCLCRIIGRYKQLEFLVV